MLKVNGDMLGRETVTDGAGDGDRLSGPDPASFRRSLAVRLLALLGTASLAGSSGGCWDGETVLTGFGGGATTRDAGGTTGTTITSSETASSATSTCAVPAGGTPCGGWMRQRCFTPAAFPCPTDPCVALSALGSGDCGLDGLEVCQIQSGPVESQGMCCYGTAAKVCVGGGRPYLVAERAVVAATHLGTGERGWSAGERPDVDALTAEERATLAEAWTANGLLEHASVASFSRFALSLLAAGAPADLVHDTHRAALDEIVHARLCFALASAYKGETVAPGPFPVGAGVHVSASLAAIAVSTVGEGCVGETVAAVVASEQLARTTDPAVRAALARIASDEARHAELAWRTVAWAVKTGGEEVRAAVAHALLVAIEGAPGPNATRADTAGDRGARTEAHGHLGDATLATVVAAAMTEVVAPAARVLFRQQISARPQEASCLA
jgi:hypothetical protein